MKKTRTILLLTILMILLSLVTSCKPEQPPVTQDQNIQQPTPVLDQVIEEPKPTEITIPQEPQKVIENKKTVVNVKKPEPFELEPMPEIHEFNIIADEKQFNPDTITVKKGEKVTITFNFNDEDIYFGGLDIKSQYFNIAYQKSDKTKSQTVEFTAEKSFNYIGYWPSTNAKKAVGRVVVE